MNKVVESFRSLMVEEQEVNRQTGSKIVKTKTAPVRQSTSATNLVRLDILCFDALICKKKKKINK